jgi:hypothetical protein
LPDPFGHCTDGGGFRLFGGGVWHGWGCPMGKVKKAPDGVSGAGGSRVKGYKSKKYSSKGIATATVTAIKRAVIILHRRSLRRHFRP